MILAAIKSSNSLLTRGNRSRSGEKPSSELCLNKEYPELEDFGDCMIVGDNGATHYFRVDWLTPDGLGTWGDGRTFILGQKDILR